MKGNAFRIYVRFFMVLVTASVFLMCIGCGDDGEKNYSLNGGWNGRHTNSIGLTTSPLKVNIVHKDQNSFSGSAVINETEYTISGEVVNNTINATLSGPMETITWTGKVYHYNEIHGTYMVMDSGGTQPTETGDFFMAKDGSSIYSKIDVPDNVKMGPWLVYYGAPTTMLVRVVLYKKCTHDEIKQGTVSVTGPDGKTTDFPLIPSTWYPPEVVKNDIILNPGWDHSMFASGDDPGHRHYLQAHLTGLTPDTEYTYKITHTDALGNDTVTAHFRTAPPVDSRERLVFYAYGDNRAEYSLHSSALWNMEDTIANDTRERSFILHGGDAVTMGQYLEYVFFHQYGWLSEWLHQKPDESKWDRHSWLRANIPTFMTVGNHELKSYISQGTYYPTDSYMYEFLMGRFYSYAPDRGIEFSYNNFNIGGYSFSGTHDTNTYYVDWGDVRVISLNTYFCYNQDNLNTLKAKLQQWVQGRKAQGKVTILVLHSPIYYGVNLYEVGYTNILDSVEKIRLEFEPIITDDVQLVITGHKHITTRTGPIRYEVNTEPGGAPVYYILGTGGAQDVTDKPTDQELVYSDTFTVSQKKFTAGIAFGRFTVDWDEMIIYADILSGDQDNNPGALIDHYQIPIMVPVQ